MSDKKIIVNFKYENQDKGEIFFESDKTLKEVCEEFVSINGLDFGSVYFMFNGKKINKSNYNKILNQLLPNVKHRCLDINVYDEQKTEQVPINVNININKTYKTIFWFSSKTTILECSLDTKMEDICKQFSQQIKRDFNKLIFKYGNEQINLSQNYSEISKQNDIERKEIDIIVEEKHEETNANDNNNYRRLNIIFAIAGVILIIIIIILILILVVKKQNKTKNNKGFIIESTWNITDDINESNIYNEENEGLDLYNGEYIPYAFYAIYNIYYYYYWSIKLFNSDRTNDLYAMKIENKIMKPNSYYNFNNQGYNIVYYYLLKNVSIDLSYLFSDVYYLINFSFNKQYINNYNIINIKGMFYGCSSLLHINLQPLNTEKLTDISYLFSGCSSLKYISLSNMNTSNIKYMNNLFSYCNSLTNIYFTNINTGNVLNMSYLFSNCKSLASIDLSSFNTQNVTDMEYMFSGCESLKLIDLSSLNTNNVVNMRNMFSGCKSLISINLTNFNTQNVENIQYMFSTF